MFHRVVNVALSLLVVEPFHDAIGRYQWTWSLGECLQIAVFEYSATFPVGCCPYPKHVASIKFRLIINLQTSVKLMTLKSKYTALHAAFHLFGNWGCTYRCLMNLENIITHILHETITKHFLPACDKRWSLPTICFHNTVRRIAGLWQSQCHGAKETDTLHMTPRQCEA